MNIIIPLGGKGERFLKEGYTQPKPLIQIFEKSMIEYVLDNLTITDNDSIYILYNRSLDTHGFSNLITNAYPKIHLIPIGDTKGAVETLFLGLEYVPEDRKCLILDCDTFYTEDIVDIFRDSNENMVFYTKDHGTDPVYSYIEIDSNSNILNIREKQKISDNANTGAYAFTSTSTLMKYCKYVLDNNITFKNEPYTSCVISEMLRSSVVFKAHELKESCVVSLGTPTAVQHYKEQTYAFLFDLDGTLITTDAIYYDVWSSILSDYNIVLNKELFTTVIQGNNDKYVVDTLLTNIDISLPELSKRKDDLFVQHIDKLRIVDGMYDMIHQIRSLGHKISIVTNCNSRCASEIIKKLHIDVDFVITNDDCTCGKPDPEPYAKALSRYGIAHNKCFVFEDSKTGLLSGKAIQPRALIGIETTYSSNELLKYGADITIPNFRNCSLDQLLAIKENDVTSILLQSSPIDDIKQIMVDDNKLKGGFIADVLSFKIVTQDGTVYPQILKYETNQENDLSTMAKRLDLYQREYYFYTTIAPKIDTIRIPKFYNLVYNTSTTPCGLVLENLKEKKYSLNLDLKTESIDITLTIVDRMARLHSSFWNKNLQRMFPELKQSISFHPFFETFLAERRHAFITKWYKILTPKQRELCERIFDNFTAIQHRFAEGNHLTFIHGDIKSPNIFYDVHHNYEPYFIDWQHCAIGKGVQDLIFFVLESFDIKHLRSVFEITTPYYHRKLMEYGITNYSIEEYQKDIYDAICYIPFFTSVWFGTVPQDELIDKNFPFFLITKMFYLLELLNSWM